MITCMAVDDDPLFLRLLESYFSEIEDLDLIKVYDNPVRAALGIVKYKPEVLLLDYDMPYLDGFEMVSMITDPPKVVVISGHLKDPEGAGIKVDGFISKKDLISPDRLREGVMGVFKD